MENTSEYTVQKASITSGTEDNTVASCFLWGCFPVVEVVVPVSVSHLHSLENVTWDLLPRAQLQRILHLLI